MESVESSDKSGSLEERVRALVQRQTTKAVVDVLLEHREVIIESETAGVPLIALWNCLRSGSDINATYSTFTAAMRQFRDLVGLPLTKGKQARRLRKATSTASATGQIEGAKIQPKGPPAARRVPSNIQTDLPVGSQKTLLQLSLEKADAPGLG